MRRPTANPPPASGTDAPEGDSFLSRWARRKRRVRDGGDPDVDEHARAGTPDGAVQGAPAQAPAADEAARRAREELTDADMPALDSIDESTDMSGFFSGKVSGALKRAALRKFFHSSAFNVVDGLDDYAEDFTSFAPLGDIVTSDMRHRMEVEAERARRELEEAGAADAEAPQEHAAQAGDAAEDAAITDRRDAGSTPDASARDRGEGDRVDEGAGESEGDEVVAREANADTVSGKLRRRERGDDDGAGGAA